MTNNLTNCPDCGANYSLVGYRHRCNPVSRAEAKTAKPPIPVSREITAPLVERAVVAAQAKREGAGPANYKYRNADEWRSYMRDYMRGYRKRKP